MKLARAVLLGFFCLFLSFLGAAETLADRGQILDPEEAFTVIITPQKTHLAVKITIEPGYYLYQSKLFFVTEPNNILKPAHMSATTVHEDEFFGRQNIFRGSAQIRLPLKSHPERFTLRISLQGCADVGLCYPPVVKHFLIEGNTATVIPAAGKSAAAKTDLKPTRPFTPITCTPANSPESPNARGLMFILISFFLAGLAMSLTACMYPLIPIVAAVIVKEGESGKKNKPFLATLIYTQGIALIYTLLGIVAGLTGTLLNVYLQQPLFILPASILIIILGLAMLDIWQFQLPASWQNRLNQAAQRRRGKNLGLLLMGMLSALMIGPCIAPPLAFALGYIGTSQNYLLGGLSLYLMGLGLGAPLLLFSLVGERLLPRAGSWMEDIKHGMGFILLLLAAYIAAPFLPNRIAAGFYLLALLFPIGYVWSAPSRRQRRKSAWTTTFIAALLLALFIAGGIFNFAPGVKQFLSLNDETQETPSPFSGPERYTDAESLRSRIDKELREHPKRPVFLDFYAEWCATCKEMEKETFADPAVREELKSQGLWLQLDLSRNTPNDRQLLKEFGLYAPPAFVVIHAPRDYCAEPLLGFKNARDFLVWLKEQL